MIGTVLGGRYVIEAVVGTGGMAIVYRAFDKIKKQPVAVKVLRPEYESDDEFVHRFSREAEAASKVSHENIVNMYDVGIENNQRYIVMEYVDGITLKQMIREQGHIDPDQAIRMTIRILAAVDHAHKNGIVHRDIKPQNILVDRQGRVKVADFGIARLKTSQTTLIDANGMSALGSVHYFSPEQAKGEVADEKSDLYSVGVVLYEMLTGQVPFDGETAVSIALKHVSEPPVSMREIQTGISKALDEVVLRALHKSSAKRYQTAAEMAADLRKTITHPRGGFVRIPLDEEELARERESIRKRRQSDRRRILKLAVLIGSVVLVCALGLLAWYYFAIHERVTMPELVERDQVYAQDALEALKLEAVIEGQYSEEVPVGLVISQSAEAGSRVKVGTGVTLEVSLGSQWYYLEELIGLPEAQAFELLKTAGVNDYDVNYVWQSDATAGTVIEQSLEVGWQSKDKPLSITVSGQSVRVPNLLGLSAEGARQLAIAEGLNVAEIVDGGAADAVPGSIIAQSIPADSEVLTGTFITLTACSGAEALYYPYVGFTVMVPLDNLMVEIELETPSGNAFTVFRSRLTQGTQRVDLFSEEQGEHTVRVYMDDVLMETTSLVFN